jgi:hypothetical protein
LSRTPGAVVYRTQGRRSTPSFPRYRIALFLGLASSLLSGAIVNYRDPWFVGSLGAGFRGGWPFEFLLADDAFPLTGIAAVEEFHILFYLFNALFWIAGYAAFVGILRWVVPLAARSTAAFRGALLLAHTPLLLWLLGQLLPMPESFFGITVFLPDTIAGPLVSIAPGEHTHLVATCFVIFIYVSMLVITTTALVKAAAPSWRLWPVHVVSGVLLLVTVTFWQDWLLWGDPASAERPFEVLELEVERNPDQYPPVNLKVHFRLRILSLPKEQKVFEVRYALYSSRRINEGTLVADAHRLNYMMQVDDVLHDMAPGTVLSDNKFVAQDITSGTIEFSALEKPQYFVVFIFEKKEDHKAYGRAYLVPLPTAPL